MKPAAVDPKLVVGVIVGPFDSYAARVEAARKLHAAGTGDPKVDAIVAAIVEIADAGDELKIPAIRDRVEGTSHYAPLLLSEIGSIAFGAGDTTEAWTAGAAVKAFLDDRQRRADADTLRLALEQIEAGGDRSEYIEKVREVLERPIQAEAKRRTGWTIAELMQESFPEIRYFVERIITPGLIMFWGTPKSGKSVAGLQMAVAIGAGGYVFDGLRAERAGVLYITLEDGGRRLQNRLRGIDAPELVNVRLETAWPSGKRSAPALARYLDRFPDIQVVIVDPFQQFTAVADTNDYTETSAVLAELKEIADSRDIAVIVVHHSRKAGKDAEGTDWGDSALGSRGMTGKPDTLMHLKRTPGETADAVLLVRSKDIEPAELALQFDPTTRSWSYIGDASEIPKTPEAQEIIDCLREAGEPMKPGAIAEAIGKKVSNVSHQLKSLSARGTVHKLSYGLWSLSREGGNTHSNHSNIQTSEDTDPTDFERLNTLNGSPEGVQSKSDTGGMSPEQRQRFDQHSEVVY